MWTVKNSKQASALFSPLAFMLQVSWFLCTGKGLLPAGKQLPPWNPRKAVLTSPTNNIFLVWPCEDPVNLGSQNLHPKNSTMIASQRCTSICISWYTQGLAQAHCSLHDLLQGGQRLALHFSVWAWKEEARKDWCQLLSNRVQIRTSAKESWKLFFCSFCCWLKDSGQATPVLLSA